MSGDTISKWLAGGQLGQTQDDELTLVKIVDLILHPIGNITFCLMTDGNVYSKSRQDRHGAFFQTDKNANSQHSIVNFDKATIRISKMAVGCRHVLFLTVDSLLYGFGSNEKGQINPDGETCIYFRPMPIQFPQLNIGNSITQISCGAAFNSAILGDNTVVLWGGNTYGQLGDGTMRSTRATAFTNLNSIFKSDNESTPAIPIHMAHGSIHSLALVAFGLEDKTQAGYICAFGANKCGQLGIGNTEDSAIPHLITNTTELLGNVVSIHCGWGHSECLTMAGNIYWWGSSRNNLPGSENMAMVPTLLRINSPCLKLVCADFINAGIFEDDAADLQIKVWGSMLCRDSDLNNGSVNIDFENLHVDQKVSQLLCAIEGEDFDSSVKLCFCGSGFSDRSLTVIRLPGAIPFVEFIEEDIEERIAHIQGEL